MSVLDDIVDRTREEVRRRRKETPEKVLRERLGAREDGRPFAEALASHPGVSVIAEHKRRAPSSPEPIREGSDVAEVVRAYERAGATALSVLTDEPFFGGSLQDLAAARAASSLPIIRKDFVVHPYQVVETAVSGADAMLLIVAALEDNELRRLYRDAHELDLDVLVEVHDGEELERALEVVDADVIGINNRNLRDLSVDLDTTFDLLSAVPAGKIVVSESGIARRDQLEELERVGVDAVLVGTHLMRQHDLEAATRELTGEV
ncbi:indole-3-glycerol phosphate synthase TrpC [Patulibacter sp. SYSU D01012]|uniref:indole-3-glycerol phosphate synthase TrpC n=1 Tax=Patulibacter sp. SYSU D01012 TaxID=2817381 RepID=UPI001B30D296|nr:indole-3-glycerol phosphate synthase TrpC [Patulibacter sp. SYSU D01012]